MNIIRTIKIDPKIDINTIKFTNDISLDYLVDESKITGGSADKIYFPKNEQEICAIVKHCSKNIVQITTAGARTGIAGSSIPFGGVCLSLEKLETIKGIGFDTLNNRWFLSLDPCVSLAEIYERLSTKDLANVEDLTPDALKNFKLACSFFYPVDPTELSASIGGTVSTNASGARSFKYGPTRKWIKKIRVVIHTGEILEIERGCYFANEENKFRIESERGPISLNIPNYKMPDAKNAAGLYAKPGMDLIDLFIGSEGIFGIISEVEVYLTEKHDTLSAILFFTEQSNAFSFIKQICEGDINPEFLEYLDINALTLLKERQKENPTDLDIPKIPENAYFGIFFDIEMSSNNYEKLEKIANSCNTSLQNSWAAHEKREVSRLRMFRHALPETVNSIIGERKKKFPKIHKLGTDMSVKDEALREMMAYYKELLDVAALDYVVFGHIGNNHVHVNILPKNLDELDKGKDIYKQFAKKAVSLGGSISAEHGVGKIKHEYLEIMYGKNGIEEMRKVKKAIDPKGIFNRNNIFKWEE